MATTLRAESADVHMSRKVVAGEFPLTQRAIDATTTVNTNALTGAAKPQRFSFASRRRPGAGACHIRAEVGRGDFRRVEPGDDLAPKHHKERVGKPDQLLEVGRNEQNPETATTGFSDVVPHCCLRTDIDAASGMGGEEQSGLREHLATDDELLLVAARERMRLDVDPGRAHVVVVHDLGRAFAGASAVDPRSPHVG